MPLKKIRLDGMNYCEAIIRKVDNYCWRILNSALDHFLCYQRIEKLRYTSRR